MNVNLYIIEDYENEPLSGPKKTNPNKPNFLNAEMNESLLAFLSGEIQSTKDYVRNYKRIMQNKPNFQKSQMNVSILL